MRFKAGRLTPKVTYLMSSYLFINKPYSMTITKVFDVVEVMKTNSNSVTENCL